MVTHEEMNDYYEDIDCRNWLRRLTHQELIDFIMRHMNTENIKDAIHTGY
jgi:formate-dependent nitrite reductase cytochrome c552 subunit